MQNIIIAWIGRTDLKAAEKKNKVGLGPIAHALESRTYEHAYFLNNYPDDEVSIYVRWIESRSTVPISLHNVMLTSPTDFGEIYHAAVAVINEALLKHGQESNLTFHLSPGTPAMAAVWILLAKTRYPAELIESSLEQGVRTVTIPFDISADFIPTLLRKSDERLERLSAGLPPEAPGFEHIIHRSLTMQRVVAKARRIAIRSVPVLIEGESGTGKELLARAIHRAGLRHDRPFIAVNCGAIPAELVESEFFGHKKGSFTGATHDRKGYFEAASGGTLFLDEIGELPLLAQVKILRVLQEKEVVRVGDTRPTGVDVRIIAATNRSLIQEVAAGRFRADLFYRLAVAVLLLPPLREREGDISLLIDHFMEEEENIKSDNNKKISSGARNIILCHPWPGNVRELSNTLQRASVWTTGDTIQADDIREAMFPVALQPSEHILNRGFADGFNIQEVMAEVARHYLQRGMDECGGNKSKAAKILGLPNYQTLTNWLKKYGLE
jgi:transcriptional regulator with PAS, ATPase and Fis domain